MFEERDYSEGSVSSFPSRPWRDLGSPGGQRKTKRKGRFDSATFFEFRPLRYSPKQLSATYLEARRQFSDVSRDM